MATQQQIEHALRRHAILSIAIERAAAMGQPASREILREVQQIEADINTILPPSAAQSVAQFQEQVKSDFLAMEHRSAQQDLGEMRGLAQAKLEVLRDKGARSVTASINNGEGGTGLNARQMQEAMSKGKFTTTPREHTRKQYEREVAKESGGTVDPVKFRREWTKAYDAPAGSATRERFLDAIGADKMERADRTKFFNQLSTEMLADEMNMRRDDRAIEADKSAFKARTHALSDRDQTRLDVTAALLKEVPRQPGLANSLMDRVSERSLTDTSGSGLRADLAASVAQHTGQMTPDEMATDYRETVAEATAEVLP